MNSLEKKIFKVASEVYGSAKEEFERLKNFYDSSEIDDYGLECRIVFFEGLKDIVTYEGYMEWYFEENNDFKKRKEKLENRKIDLDYLYESLLTWVRSELNVGIVSEIPKMDFAIYRIRSYYQFLNDINVKTIKELEDILMKIETKALLLRDKLSEVLLRKILSKEDEKFLNYNMYLEAFFLLEDEETELYIPILDLKFLRNLDLEFLRCKDRHICYEIKKSLGCHLLREFQRLLETCGWKEFEVGNLKSLITSVILEMEYRVREL